jgi:hypothetical protein
VADTVPAGGVAVTNPVVTGPEPLQVALTGVVEAPATVAVVVIATTEKTPATRATAMAQDAAATDRRRPPPCGTVEELVAASVSPPWFPRASSRIERIEPSLP